MPWIVGNLFVLGLFGRDLLVFDNGLVATNAYWGRDFINVWTSGKLLLSGRLDILYDLPAYHEFARSLFGPVGQHNFSYPPLVLPMMAFFAMLPYPVALAVWLGATGWLFVRAASPWWRDATGLPGWLVLLTPPALVNIWAGHYGFLIGALFLFGFRRLEEGRPVQAGVFFGLMVIKPHLAVLVPLVLLIRRDWSAIAAAAATVAVLIAGSLLVFGPGLWWEYLTVTTRVQATMIDAGESFFRFMSTSVATMMLQLGLSDGIAAATQLISSLLAVAIVAGAALRRVPLQPLALSAATATFLVLPYAFNYDLVVSAMGAAMLAMNRRDAPAPFLSRLALCGFMAAQLGMVMTSRGLPGIPFLLWLLLIAQFVHAMRSVPVRVGANAALRPSAA